MSLCGDEIKFVKFLNDTLFSLKGGTVTPLYKLNYGRKRMTKKIVNKVDSTFSWKCDRYCYNKKMFTRVDYMYESSRYLVIIPIYGETGEGYYWIDKNNGKGFRIGTSYRFDHEVMEVLSGKKISEIAGSSDREIISCYEATHGPQVFRSSIEACSGNIGLPDDVVRAIERVDPEGNPFLIIYEH